MEDAHSALHGWYGGHESLIAVTVVVFVAVVTALVGFRVVGFIQDVGSLEFELISVMDVLHLHSTQSLLSKT